ncbi:MAG: hypothetical protein ACP5C4_02760 [Methanomicrobiales archaeon]
MNGDMFQIGTVITGVAILALGIVLAAVIWGFPMESARYLLAALAVAVVAGIAILIRGWRTGA